MVLAPDAGAGDLRRDARRNGLSLALTNRYRIVPTMRTDEPRAIKRLTLLTLMEIALGALALLLVSVFAMLEPQ